MNKTRITIAAILICFGIIGIIPSTFFATPYVSNTIQEALNYNQQMTKVQTAATLEQPITNVNISSPDADVQVVKSTTGKIQLKSTNSATRNISIQHEVTDKTLNISIDTKHKENQFQTVDSFKDLVEESAQWIAAESKQPKFILEVPESINLSVTTDFHNVHIQETTLLKESMRFQSNYGQLYFEQLEETPRLMNLDVKSNGNIDFSPTVLSQFKQVNINANQLNIRNNHPSGRNTEQFYTEQLNIVLTDGYFDFKTPFFKQMNLDVIGYNNTIFMEIPLSYWNPLLNIQSDQQNVEIVTDQQVLHEKTFKGYLDSSATKGQMEMNIRLSKAFLRIGR